MRDIGDVRLALEGAFETTVSTPSEAAAEPALQVWQRPMPLVLGVLLLVVLSGLVVWSLTRPAPAPPGLVARFPIPLAADQTFSFTGRHIVAISPDGTDIAYIANEGLWVRPVDQLQATLVRGTEAEARSPFFSPDGQWIGFFAAGQLKKVSISGGAPVTLCAAENPWGASWGPNDRILFGQGSEGIWQVPGTAGAPEQLIAVEEGDVAHGPQMLPGGEWVLFTLRPAGTSAWDEAQIVVESVTTGERVVLIQGGRDARYVPTGHLVYVLNGVLLAVGFDLGARQVIGGSVPLVEGVGYSTISANSGAAHFSLADNGSLVYVPGAAGSGALVSLVWVSRTGQEKAIVAPPRGYRRPRVSPDGTRVAVEILEEASTDVWIWDLARERLTRLTFDEEGDAYPMWTPDGSRVVFFSGRDGGGLFWKAADGTGEVEQLLESANQPHPYGWSADGRLIFDEIAGSGRDIGVLTVEGERTMEMLLDTDFDEEVPALSPDGRWLAYRSDESGRNEVYVRPFPNIDGGHWQVSTNGAADPLWSPDGQALFFRAQPGLMVAEVEAEPTFNAGTPAVAFSTSGYGGGGPSGRYYDLAPDGERFLMTTAGGARATEDTSFLGLIFVENWFEELKARVPIP